MICGALVYHFTQSGKRLFRILHLSILGWGGQKKPLSKITILMLFRKITL